MFVRSYTLNPPAATAAANVCVRDGRLAEVVEVVDICHCLTPIESGMIAATDEVSSRSPGAHWLPLDMWIAVNGIHPPAIAKGPAFFISIAKLFLAEMRPFRAC